MKPVIIIAIAVVCSVITVLGVLFGIQEISIYQAQVAFEESQAKEKAMKEAIYTDNRGMCVKLFGNQLADPRYESPYQHCLRTDYLSAVDHAITLCISSQSDLTDSFDVLDYEIAKMTCNQIQLEKLAVALGLEDLEDFEEFVDILEGN